MSQITSNIRKTDHHATPARLINYLKEFHKIDIGSMYDPCPLHSKKNTLDEGWGKVNYVNPPYSKIKKFVAKAVYEFVLNHNETYFLFPLSKTDQDFFEILEYFKRTFIFIPFRIQFVGSEKPAFQTHVVVQIK